MPDNTRLLFLALISMADDLGRVLDSPKQIEAFIYPFDEGRSQDVRDSLVRLAESGRILRGTTEAGKKVIQITNWAKHQKIDHPNVRAALPPIVVALQGVSGAREDVANDSRGAREDGANDSRGAREDGANDSRLDLRPSTGISDQRPVSANSDSLSLVGRLTSFDDPKKNGSGPSKTANDAPPKRSSPEQREAPDTDMMLQIRPLILLWEAKAGVIGNIGVAIKKLSPSVKAYGADDVLIGMKEYLRNPATNPRTLQRFIDGSKAWIDRGKASGGPDTPNADVTRTETGSNGDGSAPPRKLSADIVLGQLIETWEAEVGELDKASVISLKGILLWGPFTVLGLSAYLEHAKVSGVPPIVDEFVKQVGLWTKRAKKRAGGSH